MVQGLAVCFSYYYYTFSSVVLYACSYKIFNIIISCYFAHDVENSELSTSMWNNVERFLFMWSIIIRN